MKTNEDEIWALLDELRNKPAIINVETIVKVAQERGISTDFSFLRMIARKSYRETGPIIPEFIPEFVSNLLKNIWPESILDPWAGYGSFLIPIVNKFLPKKSVGNVRTESEFAVSQALATKNPHIIWKQGDPFHNLDRLENKFDLIVSMPPWGMKGKVSYAEQIDLKDDIGNLIILKSCHLLSENGIGIFIVTPSFFFNRNPKSVKNNLEKFGFSLDLAFLLPPGVFEPYASIRAYLIVITRHPKIQLFVGEIFGREQQDSILIGNYRKRIAGKVPQQGFLIDEREFNGLESIIAEYEINSLVQRSNLFPIPLLDIALEINLPKKITGAEFVEKSNSIYLPVIGNSSVVSSLADLRIKPQNYVQIVLNPELAFAPYLVGFFNHTKLGQKVRDSLTSGIIIPKVTKSTLNQATVYLPENVKIQLEAAQLNSVITNLTAELTTLQDEIWEYPNKTEKIRQKLKSFTESRDLEIWMEKLPFPLASILWAYYATTDSKEKLEHLFHFFEATSQFIAMIFLSALFQDKNFYRDNCSSWIVTDEKHQGWYKHASFGNWVELNFSMAKFTRKLLNDQDTKERCLSLFGKVEATFLEMLTNKRLLGIFKEANEYRNSWKGHGGILGDEEANNRVQILETLLSGVRDIFSDHFGRVLLLSPILSEFSGGVFDYKVKAIRGTRTQFKEEQVKTLIPMDKNKLYLLPDLQLEPVEMLPFGRLMPSPKTQQNAFYFYNRFDKSGVRWVSYHFEKEAELVLADSNVVETIQKLFEIDQLNRI